MTTRQPAFDLAYRVRIDIRERDRNTLRWSVCNASGDESRFNTYEQALAKAELLRDIYEYEGWLVEIDG